MRTGNLAPALSDTATIFEGMVVKNRCVSECRDREREGVQDRHGCFWSPTLRLSSHYIFLCLFVSLSVLCICCVSAV